MCVLKAVEGERESVQRVFTFALLVIDMCVRGSGFLVSPSLFVFACEHFSVVNDQSCMSWCREPHGSLSGCKATPLVLEGPAQCVQLFHPPKALPFQLCLPSFAQPVPGCPIRHGPTRRNSSECPPSSPHSSRPSLPGHRARQVGAVEEGWAETRYLNRFIYHCIGLLQELSRILKGGFLVFASVISLRLRYDEMHS